MDRGTLLDPAADGTSRYREDTGWSTSQFSDPHWAVEYGTTLSSSPWTVVLQANRTNAGFTAAANKLTFDLGGGTYSVLPYLASGRGVGGAVVISDRLKTGASLKIVNGTFLDVGGSTARLVVGETNTTGRLFIENARLETRLASIAEFGGANAFVTVESGGTLVSQTQLRLGMIGNGLLELTGTGATARAESIFLGGDASRGIVILSGDGSLLHSLTDLYISNQTPLHPDDNIGLVIRNGTVQVDRNLFLHESYGAVSVEGGRLIVGGTLEMNVSTSDTSGGKVYFKEGRIDVANSYSIRTAAQRNFYWKEGTLGFNDAAVVLTDVQLQNLTRQGAISYGGNRAAGTLAGGQTIEAADRLTINGTAIGLAGGAIRAGSELVLNASLSGYGSLDALVSGSGAISNTSGNQLSIGALGGSNAISSAGELQVGARGVNATFSGTSNGSGQFVKVGSATQTVTGQIANAGGVDVREGTLRFDGTGLKLDVPDIAVSNGASLAFSGGATGSAGTATIGSWHTGAPARLEISGAGSGVIVEGDLSNYGWIEIAGGTLDVGGTFYNRGTLINNGQLDAAIAGGGTLSGGGLYGGAVTIAEGGVLSPGNSPGTANFVDLTLGAEGTFELELAAAAGTAGVDWDLAVVSDLLSITATAADPHVVVIKSLDAALNEGALAGFDPTQSWSWKFVSAAIADPGSIDLSALRIDAAPFTADNDLAGGSFQIAAANDGLYVDFVAAPVAVPEPGSAFLLSVVGLAAAGLRRRKSLRQKAG